MKQQRLKFVPPITTDRRLPKVRLTMSLIMSNDVATYAVGYLARRDDGTPYVLYTLEEYTTLNDKSRWRYLHGIAFKNEEVTEVDVLILKTTAQQAIAAVKQASHSGAATEVMSPRDVGLTSHLKMLWRRLVP